ncbi:hypothetical protein AVT69_gp112 [Pseudomonas phage PhiPA3]|uniref:Uncharacterized protein 113 n=1 Tax=Pseudomonas phage PhiPA3 TaxID=998086 RepID=F8SJY8_BPPA3|nr:hypothetical protein AVT69_gp112 [Pseudomonas phage PhiPA3]AEH03537.1 hypothetical protein [Pseudomonas phage PhiPA3]
MKTVSIVAITISAVVAVGFTAAAIYTHNRNEARIEKRDAFIDSICGDLAEAVAKYKRTADYDKLVDSLREDGLSPEDLVNRVRFAVAAKLLPRFEKRLEKNKDEYSEEDFGIILSRLHTFTKRVIY